VALLDRDQEHLVLRIAYDGPPFCGKTASVRALAGSLGRESFSAGEAHGRTLYFDWLDHLGGRFEGYAIRSQVVSVPGQRTLAARRQFLIDSADAVVFVVDTSSGGYQASLTALAALQAQLADRSPPVGIVVQANKRDLPGAVSLSTLRHDLGDPAVLALRESIATQGEGIRETFVFAIRLALDRVREMMMQGALPCGRPEVENGHDLLRHLRQAVPAEAGALDSPSARPTSPAAEALAEVLWEEAASPLGRLARGSAPTTSGLTPITYRGVTPGAPRLPDATIPSGMVWPPVEGRIILHEVNALQLRPTRLPSGAWQARAPGRWRVSSELEALYFDFEEAHDHLVEWARQHAALGHAVSKSRCIALAEAAPGAWRLWQIVREERSLRHLAEEALQDPDPSFAAARLLSGALLFVEALKSLPTAATGWNGDPGQLGGAGHRVYFIGDMLFARSPSPASPELGRAAFRHLLPSLLPSQDSIARQDLRIVTDELRRAGDRCWVTDLGEGLAALLTRE
jgi:hypothetical protein